MRSLLRPSSISPSPAANNPAPSVSSLTPSSISVPNGVNGLQLLVKGSNFVGTSTVQWNGSPRATSYVSGSQVIAVILPADLAAAGTNNVSVMNPAPGGGVSEKQLVHDNRDQQASCRCFGGVATRGTLSLKLPP